MFFLLFLIILILSVRVIKGIIELATKGSCSIRTFPFSVGVVLLYVYFMTANLSLRYRFDLETLVTNLIFIIFVCFIFISSIEKRNNEKDYTGK